MDEDRNIQKGPKSEGRHPVSGRKLRPRIVQTWMDMLRRCYNKNSQRYDRYGERGIRVCERWRTSFQNFYDDMGDRPSPNHSLDRIDNDGDYCPENCRWADRTQQSNNKSDCVYMEFNGERKTVTEWARLLGINAKTLGERTKKLGWTVEQAITRPVEHRRWKSGDPESSGPVGWKRSFLPIKLKESHRKMLLAASSLDWFVPSDTKIEPPHVFRLIVYLVGRGLLEKKSIGQGKIRDRHLYRITLQGKEEISSWASVEEDEGILPPAWPYVGNVSDGNGNGVDNSGDPRV